MNYIVPPPAAKTLNHRFKIILPLFAAFALLLTTCNGAADPTKGSVITTARVWASTDPTKKVEVGADGSYSLEVAGHTGSFTITAEYTATDNENYKTANPKPSVQPAPNPSPAC